MMGLYGFELIVMADAPPARRVAEVLKQMVLVLFGIALFMTFTAFAFRWPCPWVEVLGIEDRSGCDTPADTETLDKKIVKFHPKKE
jgi:hypothetical protein